MTHRRRRHRAAARPRPRLPLVVGAGAPEPAGHRGRARVDGVGPRGPPVPGLLQPAGEHQHRPPAPRGGRGDPGAGGDADDGRARRRPTSRAGAPPSGSSATRPPGSQRSSSPTAAPTPTRTRSGWPACTPAATRSCRPTARTTATPARPSWRRGTGGACPTSTPARTCTSSARTCTARSSGRPRPEQECERALHHLERVIQAEGPTSVAAILLETIPGTAGVLVPPPGYLAGVRAIADRYGILLILDEVMAGFGRTGAVVRVRLASTCVPDLITFAKGVNSGYVPAGGVILSEPIATTFDDRVFPGGLTYSGHPLAMGSIVAALDAMADEGIVENAAAIGTRRARTRASPSWPRRNPLVGEVRGLGVFWAVELVKDQEHARARRRRAHGPHQGRRAGPRAAPVRRGQPRARRPALRRHGRRGRDRARPADRGPRRGRLAFRRCPTTTTGSPA